MVRVEVYSGRPAGKTVEPTRVLIREQSWARKLQIRFFKNQMRRPLADRATVILVPENQE